MTPIFLLEGPDERSFFVAEECRPVRRLQYARNNKATVRSTMAANGLGMLNEMEKKMFDSFDEGR